MVYGPRQNPAGKTPVYQKLPSDRERSVATCGCGEVLSRPVSRVPRVGAQGDRCLGHIFGFCVVLSAVSKCRRQKIRMESYHHKKVASGDALHGRRRALGTASFVRAVFGYGFARSEERRVGKEC